MNHFQPLEESSPLPPDPEGVWVQVVCRYTPFGSGSFRGRASRGDLEKMFTGQGFPFLRLLDCYWYNEPETDDGPWAAIGAYTRLGCGAYRNFTGEMQLRTETIEQVSLLKGGIDVEPAET